jgi:hypothetical protein
MRILFVVVAIAVVTAACGTEEPTCGGGEPFYPLEENAWWVDRVEDQTSGDISCKIVSIGAPAEIRPDVVAFPALSQTEDEKAYRWQELLGDGSVRRHVDEWYVGDVRTKIRHYCPFKIRVDDGLHACPGAAWTETWRELEIDVATDAPDPNACADGITVDPGTCTVSGAPPDGCTIATAPNDGLTDKQRSWEVVAVDEQVTVPAGTFTTLHLRTEDHEDGVTNWWWARGVGKIVEDGSEGRDELVDYCLPSDGCDEPPPTEAELNAECE